MPPGQLLVTSKVPQLYVSYPTEMKRMSGCEDACAIDSWDVEPSKIILGVDPGTRLSGYGIIAVQSRAYTAVDYGCIRPPPNLKLSDRYLVIFDSIENLIDQYRPDVLAVEAQYVHKNVQSALKLGMARGAVMIAAKRRGLSVFAYAPSEAKRAVTGNGKASKAQVQGMVRHLLKLTAPPQPEDAADALALALCHAHSPVRLHAIHEV